MRVDPASHKAWRGERELSLTPREFQILELLTRRAGLVLTREAMIENVWGHESDVEWNTVDVFMSTLRRKIDRPNDPPLIQTIRGVGFCLKEAGP